MTPSGSLHPSDAIMPPESRVQSLSQVHNKDVSSRPLLSTSQPHLMPTLKKVTKCLFASLCPFFLCETIKHTKRNTHFMKYKLGIDSISKKSAKIKHQTNFVRPLYTQNAFDSQRKKKKCKSKEFNKKAVL